MGRNRPIGFPIFIFNIAIFATDGKKTGGSFFGSPQLSPVSQSGDAMAWTVILFCQMPTIAIIS
jgi:hypothetical protein